jgi:uncharacterized protein (DUF934 family)
MTLIKNQALQEDCRHYLDDDTPATNNSIVTLEYWLQHRDTLISSDFCLGLLIQGHEDPAEFANDLQYFSMVAINIPVFTDGRGYSLAKKLRESHGYTKEIRAVGDILPDQALYLTRVGFNALELNDKASAQVALEKLSDFSVFYQPEVA